MGNCYEVHGRIMLDISLLEEFETEVKGALRLCHGTVFHVSIGRHGHCWLELADLIVLDFSNNHKTITPKEVYYAVGQIKDVKKYTVDQVLHFALDTEHWGPWESAQ